MTESEPSIAGLAAPLPGLDVEELRRNAGGYATQLEKYAMALIGELDLAGRLDAAGRLHAVLVVDLARAAGMSARAGKAAGAALAARQLMDAIEKLPELDSRPELDEWGQVVAALRGPELVVDDAAG